MLQETEESGSVTEVENFQFAIVPGTAVGTRQLLIKRGNGASFSGSWGVKAFVPCRLNTHNPAVNAKE
jgi:hypothetical protein